MNGPTKLSGRAGRAVAADMAIARRWLSPRHETAGGHLVVPPASPGSLGDELIVAGAAMVLPRLVVASWRPDDRWPQGPTEPVLTSWLRGRGGLLSRRLPRRSMGAWGSISFLGADTLDGAYGDRQPLTALRLLDRWAAVGGRAQVVNFSISQDPSSRIMGRVERLAPNVRFVARGPVSASRFRRLTHRECEFAPDLAWVATTSDAGRQVQESRVADRRPAVGVNLASRALDAHGWASDVFVPLLAQLQRDGVDLVPIAHDERGRRPDADALTTVFQQAGVRPIHPPAVGVLDVGRAISRCDVVISCRMHLAIASLARGVGVVAVPYNGKFDDLVAEEGLRAQLRLISDADPSGDGCRGAVYELLATSPTEREALRTSARALADRTMAAFLDPIGVAG